MTRSEKLARIHEINAQAATAPISNEEYELFYGIINLRTGPFATRDVQKVVRDFWVAEGESGAAWLVDKLMKETHYSLMEGVSNMLADIGVDSIGSVLRALESGPRVDVAEALLKALGWIGVSVRSIAVDPILLEGVLGQYLSSVDPDIREAACGAVASVLPRDRVVELLRGRSAVESDRSVIETIDEVL